jgi:hypothetical protein
MTDSLEASAELVDLKAYPAVRERSLMHEMSALRYQILLRRAVWLFAIQKLRPRLDDWSPGWLSAPAQITTGLQQQCGPGRRHHWPVRADVVAGWAAANADVGGTQDEINAVNIAAPAALNRSGPQPSRGCLAGVRARARDERRRWIGPAAPDSRGGRACLPMA